MDASDRSSPPLAAAAISCCLALAALTVSTVPATGTDAPPVEIRVLEFNVEYGGVHVSWEKTLEVIRRSDADVVGIEEAQGHTARLARGAGYPYFSPRLQLLSRFPIVDPPGGNGIYVFVEVEPGRVVAIENVHLPSNPYGPFRVKQGAARSQVVALERRLRLPAVRPSLRAATGLLERGIPVFLLGDFNAPSWRDWTPEMVGVREHLRYPVRWPVSLAVERAGFVDSYRAVHPDPARDPGLTWWAARPDVPGWDPGAHAPQDRIDFIYAAGGAEPIGSRILGETGSAIADITVGPWPSDHRALVSTFAVTPGGSPPLVAVAHRLGTVGTDVVISFHAPGTTAGSIAIVPAGGDTSTVPLAERSTGGAVHGALTFATDELVPGGYEAVLREDEREVSRVPFWLKAPGTRPSISTGRETYAEGEPIDVSWTNARGERWDWVGVYRRHRDPRVASYLLWAYTRATVEGSTVLDERANGRFPLAPGAYSVYLLRDDGYALMAAADLTISG
jgi:endonuclease/exonuclease/phosphatase family metal-dependent hydrolase